MNSELQQALVALMMGGRPNMQQSPPAPQQVGRYGEGYTPAPGAAVPADPPSQVDEKSSRMLWQLHDEVAKENPELGRVLWQKIQRITGDF